MITKDFLQVLHGSNFINFRLIKDKHVVNLNGRYEGKMIETLKQLNEQGYNVYFTVNGGGTHSNEINKINAIFIDFDCGRDENKQYYPLEITRKFKDECVAKTKNFIYQPTFIVETRNGIHCYWAVNNDATIEQFKQCQLRLIQYFDSDKAVKTTERVMRLPGYYWTKDINNRFMCNILQSIVAVYDIKDILNSLPEVQLKEDKYPTDKTNNNIIVSLSGSSIPLSDTLNHIQKKDIEVLHAIIKPEPIALNNLDEVYVYLKKQDLNQFLGLPKTFNCIFHEDNNPSANIYIDPNTDYYWYKCFSSKCGVVKDIISITENLLKCNTPKALKFLRQVYRIEFAETEWQKEMKNVLNENIRLLMDNERFKSIAPKTYSRIRSYILDLIVITNYAREKVYTENFTDSRGLPLFFSSLDYLNKLCRHSDHKRISNEVSLLTYLGLINKLNKSQIPVFLLNESKHQAALKHQGNLIGYYSIPSYCDEVLTYSEFKAKEFKSEGLTMRGLSRELIFRKLGEAEADRVYPQLTGKPLTEESDDFACEVDKVVMDFISRQVYVIEKQILQCFGGNKEVLKCRLKRVIPETLDKYDLVRVKLNKRLKNNLDIDETGYPFIILESNKFELYSIIEKVAKFDNFVELLGIKSLTEENRKVFIETLKESMEEVA